MDSKLDPNKMDVVVTNHGRSAIVIADLKLHIPIEEVFPNLPDLERPQVKKPRLVRLRRKLKTRGSRNDVLAMFADSWLSRGEVIHDVVGPQETILIGPKQPLAQLVLLQQVAKVQYRALIG